MNKTYSEMRQEAYFRCAIELYRLCAIVRADILPKEGKANHDWADGICDTQHRLGGEMESRGHEQCIASDHWERRLSNERISSYNHTTEGKAAKARILVALGFSEKVPA